MKIFATLTLAAVLSLAALFGAAPLAAQDVTIGNTEFGLFSSADRRAEFTRSNKVPLTVGQVYGWRVIVSTNKNTVRFREEFTLPRAPQSWGSPQSGLNISADRKTSVVERDVPAASGLIENRWSVAAGDPAGEYLIRVLIDGKEAATFRFTVQ